MAKQFIRAVDLVKGTYLAPCQDDSESDLQPPKHMI